MLAPLVSILVLNAVSSSVGIDLARSSFTADVIKARGFISELHVLKTTGDVPLTLHRVINPLANPEMLNKYPVLYGHGLLYDSQSMISRSEHTKPRKPLLGEPTINYGTESDGTDDYSLPFMYSNNNFDVWLYDARATNDGNRNATTETDFLAMQKYWDFSLDDEALDDLPLCIDYVLNQTASSRLIYTGYSESTFFMFALQSAKPEYGDKVAVFVALAPVAYVSNIKGFTLPTLIGLGAWTPEFLHAQSMPQPLMDAVDASLRTLCSKEGWSQLFCTPVVRGIGGVGAGEMAPNFFANFFKSTSVKVLKHFLQLYMRKRFSRYDYGELMNLKIYGQKDPPNFDLSKVRCKGIILARGLNDILSDPPDQERLIKELGTKPYLDIVIPQYNHFDFIDGKDLVRIINGPVMKAVYDLMYRDEPNIIRTPEQNLMIREARKRSTAIRVEPDVAPDQVPLGQTPDFGLLKLPTDVVKDMTGGSGMFNQRFLLSALGRRRRR